MGVLCLQTRYLHFQMTRTSRGPSATAEILIALVMSVVVKINGFIIFNRCRLHQNNVVLSHISKCIILMLQEQQHPVVSFSVRMVESASQLVLRTSSVLVLVGTVAHPANTEYHLASTSATGRLTTVASSTQKTATKAA